MNTISSEYSLKRSHRHSPRRLGGPFADWAVCPDYFRTDEIPRAGQRSHGRAEDLHPRSC
jgi:hypothetical protein